MTNTNEKEEFDTFILQNIANSNLSFLSANFKLYEEIKNISLKEPQGSMSYSVKSNTLDNFIYDASNKYYLSKPIWDKINTLLVSQKARLDSLTLQQTLMLELNAFSIINDVFSHLTNLRESQHPGILLLNQFKLPVKQMSLVTNFIFENLIITEARKNNYDFEQFKYNYTTVAVRLGKVLFNLFLNTTTFNKLLVVKSKQITLDSVNNLKLLLSAIITKDHKQYLSIYENVYKLKITNTLIIKLINTTLINFIIVRKLENSPDFYDLYPLIDKYIITGNDVFTVKKSLEEEITPIFLTLGACIVEGLIEFKFLEKTLVREDKITTWYIKIKEKLSLNLLKTATMHRPSVVYSEETLEHTSTIYNENDLSIFISNIQDFIHTNPDINTVVKENTVLAKTPKILHTYFSIDKQFLYKFLMFACKFLNKKFSSITHKDELYTFLSIFDIDFNLLFHKCTLDEERIVIEKLITFSLNFNELLDESLKLEIATKFTNLKLTNYYKNLFSKLVNYKIYLISLLQESLLYSLFGYFITTGFIDARGRSYMHGYALNIQNYVLGRSFIKLFCPTEISTENYSMLQDVVKNNLKYDSSKDAITDIDFTSYNTLQKDLVTSSVSNYFKNTLTKVDVESLLQGRKQNFSEILMYLAVHIKDKHKLMLALSYILLEQTQGYTHYKNIYGYDASTSALQMEAILFRNKSMGYLSNLCGTSKTDVYSLASNSFKHSYVTLDDLYTKVTTMWNFNGVISQDTPTFYENLHALASKDLFRYFMQLNLNTTDGLPKIVALVQQSCYTQLTPYIEHCELDPHLWLLCDSDKNLLKKLCVHNNSLNTTFVTFLFVLKSFHTFKQFLEKLSWIQELDLLFVRELFKKAVMTFGYSATAWGRKSDFILYFSNNARDLVGIWDIDHITLAKISEYLERFFIQFKDAYLVQSQDLKDISGILAKRKLPVTINNKYLSICFNPRQTTKHEVRIYHLYKTSCVLNKLILRKITSSIDVSKFKSKFGPTLIHSMDASLMLSFKDFHYKVNEALKECNIYISNFVNHDCFCTLILSFLLIILKDLYKELYNSDYLSTIFASLMQDPDVLELIKKYVLTVIDESFMDDDFPNKHFMKLP